MIFLRCLGVSPTKKLQSASTRCPAKRQGRKFGGIGNVWTGFYPERSGQSELHMLFGAAVSNRLCSRIPSAEKFISSSIASDSTGRDFLSRYECCDDSMLY